MYVAEAAGRPRCLVVASGLTAALWGAVADFFPAKGRAMMLALLEKGMAVREKALGLVMGRLEAPLTPAPISSPPASPSPGRSESTPTRERFGS